MVWSDICRAFNIKVNSKQINKCTERDCRELLNIIEKLYSSNWHSCYYLVRELNNKEYPGWQGKTLLSHLRFMCINILKLEDTSFPKLLYAIALDESRDEMKINPADFAIHVKRQMWDEVFFELCKIAFYEGKFNKEDLESLVKELDNEEIITLFSDIDISKRPTWKEQDYSERNHKRYNRYSEKKVSYSYNKYIAGLLQNHLSYKEQYDFVLQRQSFNSKSDSVENWGLSYYLIARLEG